ncbi:MAG: alanine--tRNA ligase-related protein [Candidatus Woesearchaeota archaeon]
MSKALYMEDSYLKEFESTIQKINGNKITLKETAFYPHSGGQPNDTGKIIINDEEYQVVDVRKDKREIVHELNKPLNTNIKEGDKVKGIIDWTRRYKLMKAHTATHILCSILHKNKGALITGNQLYEDKIRIDFNIENYDPKIFEELVKDANKILNEKHEIIIHFMPKEEAFKIEGALKLANILPPDIETLRVIEIKNVDIQVDGGTHVKNTEEIPKLKFVKSDNKGKNNRRITVCFEE